MLAVIFAGLFPLFYFSAVELGIAEAAAQSDSTGQETPPDFGRYITNDAFGVGEKFTYDVRYGFITAGEATMEVVKLIEWQSRPCYQVVTHARSNSFFSTFYKVDDRVESIVDATGIFSWRFEKSLREGNYRSDREYEFDQRNHYTVYKGDTMAVAPYVQDALSEFFYVRTQPLEVGKSIYLDNFIDGREVHLEVRVTEKETITVAAGTFDCIVVEPITQSVGLFKHEGELKVWLTDDRLHMPVLMKSKILVGSISVELTDYQLGTLEEF